MAKKRSKIAQSLKELGDIQVSEWDFMGLLQTDIAELQIGDSLRRLGKVRVMEWDFKSVMPAVKHTANIEIDVIDCFKRAAAYKVMDWDFRSSPDITSTASVSTGKPSEADIELLVSQLREFLEYTAKNLIDEPLAARVEVGWIAPMVVRFKLLLAKRDAAKLIGLHGHTAAAIRNIMKAMGRVKGIHVLLEIPA
jgi:predicted RNA-binding protein YlqC (UPF0109 family)